MKSIKKIRTNKYIIYNRLFRLPRIWSNRELLRFAHLFSGDIINVSGWTDIDKMGSHYKDYFGNANTYSISNYYSEERGVQGFKNEFIIDLTKDLDPQYINKFDVVFNHTTLEHIYQVRKAFKNLCLLSNDIVIIVVPFIQIFHGEGYGGDFWRFTPFTIKKLFEENDFEILYLNYNKDVFSSVYIFAIGSKKPETWKSKIQHKFNYKNYRGYIGWNAFPRSPLFLSIRVKLLNRIIRLLRIK